MIQRLEITKGDVTEAGTDCPSDVSKIKINIEGLYELDEKERHYFAISFCTFFAAVNELKAKKHETIISKMLCDILIACKAGLQAGRIMGVITGLGKEDKNGSGESGKVPEK